MDQNAVKLYESLFTIEEMLTEVVAECANASELASQAHLSEISKRLHAGLLAPLEAFLDQRTPTSMSTLIEIADGVPAPRMTEATPAAPLQRYEEPYEEEEDEDERYDEELSDTGNPKYDDMFNNLLESSKELTSAGRKFKLDEIDKPDESELEHPITATPTVNNPPRLPGQREKVEFDGMENWRSIVNESTPSQPGGGAEDAINSIMNFSEATPATPPQGSPEIGNASSDVDPSVANILSNL